MPLKNVVCLVCILGVSLFSRSSDAEESSPLKTRKEKLSYSMGVTLVWDLQRASQDIDYDALIMGIRDATSSRVLLLEDLQIRSLIKSYKMERQSNPGIQTIPAPQPK
jgi:FKBP-type peptidyl-prolyl cis-trans isomerase FklB